MKYLSLFSGIGGFELGIQQAYEIIRNQSRRTQPEEEREHDTGIEFHDKDNGEQSVCVGYSEIDKYAIQIYERHFNHKNYGDITKIKAEDLPEFDLVVGGFPCQSFSIAGKRGGFNDTRGTLFFEIARILKTKQPRLLLLENVKGLLSHDEGRTFATIISTLDELGYDCQWQVLNSKNFGVPQNRERVFIIGHLRGTSRPKVFPIEQSSQGNLKYSGGVISAREQWLKDGKSNSRNFSQGQRIYGTNGISQTLAGNAGGQGGKTGLYAVPAQWRRTEKGKAFRKEAQKNGKDLTPFNNGYRELVPKDSEIIGTITSQAIAKDSLLFDQMKIRRLTPTECERLQGFPDGWTDGVSDTQRYKCLGNAVTVNVVREIAKRLL